MGAKAQTREIITFSNVLLQQVEDYRRTQDPIPAKAEAIRRLVRAGLEASQIEPRPRPSRTAARA